MQFPITAIREIKILKKLHHENVIKLKEIVTSPGISVFTNIVTFIILLFACSYSFFLGFIKGPERDEQGRIGNQVFIGLVK